jgi:coenzyme F420-reducing hydrogenase gamma subunit
MKIRYAIAALGACAFIGGFSSVFYQACEPETHQYVQAREKVDELKPILEKCTPEEMDTNICKHVTKEYQKAAETVERLQPDYDSINTGTIVGFCVGMAGMGMFLGGMTYVGKDEEE